MPLALQIASNDSFSECRYGESMHERQLYRLFQRQDRVRMGRGAIILLIFFKICSSILLGTRNPRRKTIHQKIMDLDSLVVN